MKRDLFRAVQFTSPGWLALVLVLWLPAPASADPLSATWKTREINGLAYVSISDVANAFGMEKGKRRANKREIVYTGDAHRLAVKTGTREAMIDGVRHWLSYPSLTKSSSTYVSLADLRETLIPAMSPASVKTTAPVRTVVFDPGHGGHNRGAIGPQGYEKDYALDTVKRARRILEAKGIKVVQSRLSDFFVPLYDRPEMTENYEKPIFVSVHFNAASWRPSATGIEVFALPAAGLPATGKEPNRTLDHRDAAGNSLATASFVLANTMHHSLLGKMPTSFDRGVKRERFVVLRTAEVPAILIEGGFLTNSAEAKAIHSASWREKLAEAIATGILSYIELANEKRLPKRVWDYGRQSTDSFVTED
ncbi:MAG: N-acetylmuramoyl-L-alanine amidase [Verrucomicrobiota bacterium]